MDGRVNVEKKHVFRPDFLLKIWEGEPCAVSENGNIHLPIKRTQALALSRFDGRRSDEEAEAVWNRLFFDDRHDADTEGKQIPMPTAFQAASARLNLLLPVTISEKYLGRCIRKTERSVEEILRSAKEPAGRCTVPESIVWRYTDRCRRRCPYCYEKEYLGQLPELLSSEQKINLVKKLFDCGIKHVHLTGGDPFAEKDIYEVIFELLDCNIEVSVLTKEQIDIKQINGWRTDKLHLGISVDSSDPVKAGLLCGDDAYFQTVAENMDCLKGAGVRFFIAYTLNRLNLNDIEKDADWFLKQGAEHVEITEYQSRGIPEVDRRMAIDRREWEKVRELENSRIHFAHGGSVNCSSGTRSMTIDADGTVIICDVQPAEKRFASLIEHSLTEIWNGEAYVRYCTERGGKCFRSGKTSC